MEDRSLNAAPVVGRTITRVGAMLGVVPDANKDIDVSDILPTLWQDPTAPPVDGR